MSRLSSPCCRRKKVPQKEKNRRLIFFFRRLHHIPWKIHMNSAGRGNASCIWDPFYLSLVAVATTQSNPSNTETLDLDVCKDLFNFSCCLFWMTACDQSSYHLPQDRIAFSVSFHFSFSLALSLSLSCWRCDSKWTSLHLHLLSHLPTAWTLSQQSYMKLTYISIPHKTTIIFALRPSIPIQ